VPYGHNSLVLQYLQASLAWRCTLDVLWHGTTAVAEQLCAHTLNTPRPQLHTVCTFTMPATPTPADVALRFKDGILGVLWQGGAAVAMCRAPLMSAVY
jgi:hypothetical protein